MRRFRDLLVIFTCVVALTYLYQEWLLPAKARWDRKTAYHQAMSAHAMAEKVVGNLEGFPGRLRMVKRGDGWREAIITYQVLPLEMVEEMTDSGQLPIRTMYVQREIIFYEGANVEGKYIADYESSVPVVISLAPPPREEIQGSYKQLWQEYVKFERWVPKEEGRAWAEGWDSN